MKLELPLPPSVNAAFLNVRGRRFNKPETLAWYQGAVLIIRTWMRKSGTVPFTGQVYCDLELYLRRRGSDSHNYLKILLDSFEKAGLVANDDLILPRIQLAEYDAKNPRVLATFILKS